MSTNKAKNRFHELLEYTYRLDTEPREWQRRLTEEIRQRLPDGPGLLSYEFDIRAPRKTTDIGRVIGVGDIGSFTDQTEPVHEMLEADIYRRLMEGLGTHAATIREALEKLSIDISVITPVVRVIEGLGFQDIWGICSMNPDAVGIAFAMPLIEREDVKSLDRHAWTQVAAHIAAAHRLQRRLRRYPNFEDAEGIFRADGREVQLGGPAIDEREALRRFIRAVDKAKAEDYRSGEDSTLDVWKALVRGRWSLVDHIDSDGARYFLAIKNDPDTEAPHSLSRREAQVATYAAQSHTNKEIAYELGLAVSTVASHLSKALTKLGLGSRTELVWLYGHLRGGAAGGGVE